MKTVASNHQRGKFNSSITRVRPVFQELINQDRTGLSWLPEILKRAPINRNFATRLSENPGTLLEETLQIQRYPDRVLKEYGVDKIDLETCFEKSLPPPARFLRWLIENPSKMSWPKGKFSKETLYKREKLFDEHGEIAAQETRQEALLELEHHGSLGSAKKWWAFEGFTEVDCCLETDRLVLFIEGKRKESLSPSTAWYPARNQLIRNLEVAQEIAGDKDFAVIVIAKQDIGPISEEIVEKGLPHFNQEERNDLMKHYLGCILWPDLCHAVGMDYNNLPKTTTEVVEKLKCPMTTQKMFSWNSLQLSCLRS